MSITLQQTFFVVLLCYGSRLPKLNNFVIRTDVITLMECLNQLSGTKLVMKLDRVNVAKMQGGKKVSQLMKVGAQKIPPPPKK